MSKENDDVLERQRVHEAIASHIIKFWWERAGSSEPEFHLVDVTKYVQERVLVAPDSPGRIMRLLNAENVINVQLLSRSQSLYRALPKRKYVQPMMSFAEEANCA